MADGSITVEVSTQAAQAELERLRAENAVLESHSPTTADGPEALELSWVPLNRRDLNWHAHATTQLRAMHAALSAAENTPRDPLEIEELWDAWRGEVEDGSGWGGLVASKSEQREEARQAALEKATGLRAKDWSPGLGVVDGTELAQLCRAMLEAPGAHLGAYLTQIQQVLIDSEAK